MRHIRVGDLVSMSAPGAVPARVAKIHSCNARGARPKYFALHTHIGLSQMQTPAPFNSLGECDPCDPA